MDFEEVLKAVNTAVFASEGRHLTQVEEDVLRGAWLDLTYPEIAKTSSYSLNYLKQDVGPNLWKLLSRVLGEEVGKSNFRSFMERYFLKQVPISVEPEMIKLQAREPRTASQGLSSMLNRIDKACFEAAGAISGDNNKQVLLNAYVQMMNKHLTIFSRNISEINKGIVEISGQQRLELNIQLLKQLLEKLEREDKDPEKSSLYAVSYGDIHRWWETSLAQEFRDLNGELAKYIHVERIFILPDREAEENMKITMDWHRYLGIDVYSLIGDDPEIRVSFLVCDNLFTNLINISRNGEELDGYISVNNRDIARNLNRYKAIKKLYGNKLRKVELGDEEG
jgi:hypothetical protein